MEQTYTLTLTENCNLACVYCYEHNRNGRTMNLDTAKAVLYQAFAAMQYDDLLTIDFFGGEPFLEFDLMKEIVKFTREAAASGRLLSKYRFFATSNGTLIHGDIQKWLRDNPSFHVGLSLDGTRQMQDINRCHSFDRIDLPFFHELYPKQPVKMTISDQTLEYLADGVIFCHENGFQVSCNLAYGIDWEDKAFICLLEKQMDKLIDYYIQNPAIPPCSLLSRKLAVVGAKGSRNTIQRWCGAGTAMHTFDCDGTQYPCQFFMPVSCGKQQPVKQGELHFYENIPIEVLDEKCQNCVANGVCPTCYGSNYVESGNIYHKNDAQCTLEKKIIYENACFFVKRWDAGMLAHLPENELRASLLGAKLILEQFAS